MWGVGSMMRRPLAAASGLLRRSTPRSLQLTARRAFAEQPAAKPAVKPEAAPKLAAETASAEGAAARPQADGTRTATEQLKAKKKRTKMIMGGIAATGIAACTASAAFAACIDLRRRGTA